MTLTQIIFMAILCATAVIRAVLLRRCAFSDSAKIAGVFSGVWMLACVIAVYPIFGHLLHQGISEMQTNPILLLIALAKGAVLWSVINLRQIVMKHSTSATAFMAPLVLGFLAIGNFFQGELLTPIQWVSVIILTALGFVFTLRGHLSTLETKHKALFFLVVLLMSTLGMADHAVISTTNWYTLLFFCSVSMVALSAFAGLNKQDWKLAMLKPSSVAAGAFWGVSEMIILYSFITIVPVTIGVMAITMSTPVLMILSAVIWHEGKLIHQAAFGLLGFMAMVPLIL